MNKDRIEQAKLYFRLTKDSVLTKYGVELGQWLVAELEQSRTVVKRLTALLSFFRGYTFD